MELDGVQCRKKQSNISFYKIGRPPTRGLEGHVGLATTHIPQGSGFNPSSRKFVYVEPQSLTKTAAQRTFSPNCSVKETAL